VQNEKMNVNKIKAILVHQASGVFPSNTRKRIGQLGKVKRRNNMGDQILHARKLPKMLYYPKDAQRQKMGCCPVTVARERGNGVYDRSTGNRLPFNRLRQLRTLTARWRQSEVGGKSNRQTTKRKIKREGGI